MGESLKFQNVLKTLEIQILKSLHNILTISTNRFDKIKVKINVFCITGQIQYQNPEFRNNSENFHPHIIMLWE